MNLTHEPLVVTAQDLRDLWRMKNHRVLLEIAGEFELSYTFVRKVFRGEMQSRDRRVERRLAELGCPGFEDYVQGPSTIGEVSSPVNGPDGQ